MGEHIYKVGDWVRSLVNWGSIEKGEIYQIPHLDNDGEPWFTPDGDGGWNDYLSLSEIEPWTPKVGERVRFVRDNTDGGAKYGAKGEVVTVMSVGSDIGNCRIDVSSSHLTWHHGAYLSDLEPLPVAPQPAAQEPALKIEAGRYYKTRDGRKVLVDHNPHYNSAESDSYPWKHDCGYGGYHGLTETGTSCINHSGSDLIAEWQDAPSAPVAAQVDAIAEEYGPAPPHEPDTTLRIKFTSDFSELDAAILVRKKKLKELIKLARKAGIDLREAA